MDDLAPLAQIDIDDAAAEIRCAAAASPPPIRLVF